jgi:hypothetical protein
MLALAFSPAAFPHGVALGAAPRPGWAQLAPVGFGGFGRFGAGAPPPPPPPPAGYQMTPKACPAPGSSGPEATTSTPVPPVRWIRYQDPGFQEAYARIYGALRAPAVAGITIVPEEQADLMARQIIDAIIALPQSSELRFRVGCMAKSYITGPIGLAVGAVVLLGLVGGGIYAYKRIHR